MTGKNAVTLIPTITALLLVTAPAAAQSDEQDWLRNCERQADRAGKVTLCELRAASGSLAAGGLNVDAGPNGGVIVRGGDVRDVEISAAVQVQAPTQGAAERIARDVRVVNGPGELRAEGPRTSNGENWSVTYYVTVPRQTNLELATVNGPISVRHVSGRIRASTTNGPLAVDDVAGDVVIRTANGPLNVALRGSRWDGVGLDAETANGPVSLTIPDGYSAALEAGTVNGPVNFGFPITLTAFGRSASRFETTLGQGGPPVRVVTTNGPFSTHRR